MKNVDLKDRMILYQLDVNSRQSLAQIGKRVGLSKKVVSYRIERMQDEGIIKNYWTVIDSCKLGYDIYRYYLILQNVNPDIIKEIIDYFVTYKNSCVVGSIKGIYDISLVLWVKNVTEFYKFWDVTNDKYGAYFKEKIFSVYTLVYCYKSTFLIPNEYKTVEREEYQIVGEKQNVETDTLDHQLLAEIATDARASLLSLADKLGCSSQTVKYRIKHLLKKGVIQGFRVDIDVSKLGFKHYKVDIFLNDCSKKRQLWKYLSYNPFVTYINTSIGYADLEIEFIVENSDALLQVINNLSVKFPQIIKNYVYYEGQKTYKTRCIS